MPTTADEAVAVGAGEHAEAAAQLVGEVPAHLPPVALLEQFAPAAALAEAGDPGVELGDLGGVAFGERGGGALDVLEQLVGRAHDGGAGAVEPSGELGEHPPALGERRVGGEEAGPVEVAAGGRCRLRGVRPASTPSATSCSTSRLSGIAPKSMRTQREAIVIRSAGRGRRGR